MTLAGSFISKASIFLIRVAILASAAMDDFRDRSPPFEALDCEFLGFFEAGSHYRVFSTKSSNKLYSDSHPFTRTLPDTWFQTGFLFDNLSHRRESGTDAISHTKMRALS